MKISIFLFLIIGIAVSLKPFEICKNSQQVCKGTYNSFNEYKLDCNPISCQGYHHFKCKGIYCTNNAKSCIFFYDLNRPKTSMLRLPQRPFDPSFYAKQINDCKPIEYKLNQQDICWNSKTCVLHEMLSAKRIQCPCKGKHNYHCANKYCTLNSIVCDQLMIKLKSIHKNEREKFSTKCSNSNQSMNYFKSKSIIV